MPSSNRRAEKFDPPRAFDEDKSRQATAQQCDGCVSDCFSLLWRGLQEEKQQEGFALGSRELRAAEGAALFRPVLK